MNINAQNTIAEVVSNNIKSAHIFKKYGIDFCCGGGKSIENACLSKNINVEILLKEIDALNDQKDKESDYNSFELTELINHIVQTHHAYIESNFPLLDAYITKVIKVHANHHEPLNEIGKLYDDLKAELIPHLQKEERILFPYITYLSACEKANISPNKMPFGSVSSPISQMQHEHDLAGEIMKKINTLTNQYTPPEWACNTFKALYAKLQEFEEDLHIHVHLENNILFKKAILLENEIIR